MGGGGDNAACVFVLFPSSGGRESRKLSSEANGSKEVAEETVK